MRGKEKGCSMKVQPFYFYCFEAKGESFVAAVWETEKRAALDRLRDVHSYSPYTGNQVIRFFHEENPELGCEAFFDANRAVELVLPAKALKSTVTTGRSVPAMAAMGSRRLAEDYGLRHQEAFSFAGGGYV